MPKARVQPVLETLRCGALCGALLAALALPASAHEPHPCVDGFAGPYPCDAVDMERRVHLEDMGGTGSSLGADIWGWTDSVSGREFALMGMTDQTAFVEITDPKNPVYLGSLATATVSSTWRDIKAYDDHAFIVADGAGSHGMQVFDLGRLLTVVDPPVVFTADERYSEFGQAHNIVINEESARAYAVGSDTCGTGLHVIDISTPTEPSFLGCFADDGYTHDAQCVVYDGPDADHTDKEICFGFNTDTLTIVDATDGTEPSQVSRTGYTGTGYTHQGWATEDLDYLLMNDETDELSFGHNTKTYLWDIRDLDAPSLIGVYTAAQASSDHNLYVRGPHAFLANYSAGLRILDISDIASADISEIAFFDTNDSHDNVGFDGAWSSYPYYPSGVVVVSDRSRGLFVLRPTGLCQGAPGITDLTAVAAGDQRIDLTWTDTAAPGETYNIYRSFEGCPGSHRELIASGVTGGSYSDTTASGSVAYFYDVRKSDTFACEGVAANCASATTTGSCTAPPVFETMVTVDASPQSTCLLGLDWDDAASNCGGEITYSVYQTQGTTPDLGDAVLLAEGLSLSEYVDDQVLFGEQYRYFVVAEDASSGGAQTSGPSLAGSPIGNVGDTSWTTGAELGDPVLDSTSGALRSPFENGSGLVTGFAKHAGWHLSDARANTGTRSFYSQYSNNLCSALVTESLDLTPGQSPSLSFWTVYDIEADFDSTAWDGGVVEISDDGASWTRLSLVPGYPTTWRSSADACGYGTGSPTFSGTDLEWTEYTVDLSPWAGEQVEIRWNFSTDALSTQEGWYVDDISVTHVQRPTACTSASVVFEEDFEGGSLSSWSGIVP